MDLSVAGRSAKVAAMCFLISVAVFTVSLFAGSLEISSELCSLKYWGPAFYFCLFNFILRYCYKDFLCDVSIRATFLGSVFAIGLYMSSLPGGWRTFGMYAMVLSFFHFSEFMAVALLNPSTLSIDSFILNHSVQYGVAAVASWIEWGVEFYFFPGMKSYSWLSLAGLVLCIGGEILRKGAMIAAKTNFNHIVQLEKQPEHRLVTSGLYAVCRHPAYVGWFYWSIGTQVLLLNPLCTALYAAASWRFFAERVPAEELALLQFFGRQYRGYQARVPTGLPFIRGCVPAAGRADHSD